MTRTKNVRNTTKFKRSIKAISPVIATLLMIAIAVVASLVVYAWVTGYIGGTTSTAGKAIQIQSFASQGGNLVIYVQNVGQGDVELNRDQSVYVNSNLIPLRSTMPAKIPIVAGQTEALLTDFAYTAGTKVNIKVTTTDGTFMTITGTGGSSNPTTPATTYAVSFVLGTGGLSMNPTGPQTVGGTIAISATENTGYHFTSWGSTGSITFGDASLASTSATINGAGTVTANFAADTVQYSVTFAKLGDASAVISPLAGTYSYDAGSSVPITATASSGYHFTSWGSTGSITFGDASLASTSATINGAGTVTANFAADTVQYSVTFAKLGDASAVISPLAGTYSYDAGSSVPITATASSGYHFTSWGSTGSITFGDASLASTSATINGAGTVTANFAVNTPQTITIRPSGTGSTEQLDETYSSLDNWQCVEEVSSDGDNYYIYDGEDWNGYDSDTYATENHGTESGTINSVQVFINCRKDGSSSGTSYARTVVPMGGNNYFGSGNALSTSYTTYSTTYTSDPSGGAWTWADIDALECGVSLDSDDTSGSSQSVARCTQVWVVVTYTP